MPTRDEYADRIKINLGDNNLYYSDVDIEDSLQDGYDEIAAISGSIMKAAVIDYVPRRSYYDLRTIIPDYLCTVAIWSQHRKRWLSSTTIKTLDNMRWDWEIAIGDPYVYAPVNFRYITIFPKPATPSYGKMHIFYRASADTLDGTSTPQFPQEYDHALENYVTADLHEQQLEYSKAQIYWKEHLEHLENLRLYIKSQRLPDKIFGLK